MTNKLSENIESIKKLSAKDQNLKQDIANKYGVDPHALDLSNPKQVKAQLEIGGKVTALKDYLEELSLETLKNLAAIMYAGRNNTNFHSEKENLTRKGSSEKDFLKAIAEKSATLPSYFEKGIDKCRADGIDIDNI